MYKKMEKSCGNSCWCSATVENKKVEWTSMPALSLLCFLGQKMLTLWPPRQHPSPPTLHIISCPTCSQPTRRWLQSSDRRTTVFSVMLAFKTSFSEILTNLQGFESNFFTFYTRWHLWVKTLWWRWLIWINVSNIHLSWPHTGLFSADRLDQNLSFTTYLRGWNSFSYPGEAETGPKGGKISHTQELCCEGFFVFFKQAQCQHF